MVMIHGKSEIKKIGEKAMLANLRIKTWSAMKHEAKADKVVVTKFHAQDNAGKFNKRLINSSAMREIMVIVYEARKYHQRNTLPWTDTGQRLLPSRNFSDYRDHVNAFEDSFRKAVAGFVSNYDTVKAQAKELLGDMYDKYDYPHNINQRFDFGVNISPIPMSGDFRVSLGEFESKKIKKDIEKRTMEALVDANKDLYRRLGVSVSQLIDKLNSESGVVRNSIMSDLAGLCELIPRLNITEDEELDDLRKRVEKKLCSREPREIRDSDAIRKKTVKDAKEILKAMEGMYGTPANSQ